MILKENIVDSFYINSGKLIFDMLQSENVTIEWRYDTEQKDALKEIVFIFKHPIYLTNSEKT